LAKLFEKRANQTHKSSITLGFAPASLNINKQLTIHSYCIRKPNTLYTSSTTKTTLKFQRKKTNLEFLKLTCCVGEENVAKEKCKVICFIGS
jgi:hypothetical protein